MNYKLELTGKQVEAISAAIYLHAASYKGYSDEELREFEVKRELLALRQVQTKLDKYLDKASA
jgi:hypothetical protein